MPSVLIKRQIKKKPHDIQQTHWSEKQRLEAVTTYLLVGTMVLVSQQTGIPLDTLYKWKAQDWWKEAEGEVRRSSNLELGGKLKGIRDRAISVVQDRLEHGELIFDPVTKTFTGRKPVNAKQAAEIMVKTIDREVLINKLEEKPQLKEEAIMDRLKSIEEVLIRASKHKLNKGKTIDVTILDNPVLGLPNNDRFNPHASGTYADTHTDSESANDLHDDLAGSIERSPSLLTRDEGGGSTDNRVLDTGTDGSESDTTTIQPAL